MIYEYRVIDGKLPYVLRGRLWLFRQNQLFRIVDGSQQFRNLWNESVEAFDLSTTMEKTFHFRWHRIVYKWIHLFPIGFDTDFGESTTMILDCCFTEFQPVTLQFNFILDGSMQKIIKPFVRFLNTLFRKSEGHPPFRQILRHGHSYKRRILTVFLEIRAAFWLYVDIPCA